MSILQPPVSSPPARAATAGGRSRYRLVRDDPGRPGLDSGGGVQRRRAAAVGEARHLHGQGQGRRGGRRGGRTDRRRPGNAEGRGRRPRPGVDLKVVSLEKSPPIDTPLRDIATQVGQANPGSTVLVLSPGWAGSYSTTYDRVLLEAGQDVAKLAPNPVQGAQNFVDQLKTPIFPWTAFTIVVVLGVTAAAIATRFLQRWAKRGASAKT